MNRSSNCIRHTRRRRGVRNKHHTMKGGTEPASTPGGRFLTSLKTDNPEDYKRKYTPKGNTFLIRGHGCDTGIEFQIPEHCAYYTRALCGKYTYTDEVNKTFTETFIKHDTLKNLVKEFNLHAHTYRNKTNKTINNINYDMNHIYSNSYYNLLSIFYKNVNSISNLIISYIHQSKKNSKQLKAGLKKYLDKKLYLLYSGIIEYKQRNTVDFTSMRSVYSLLFNTDDEYNTFCDNCGPNFENNLSGIIIERLNSRISEKNFFSDLIDYTYKYSFFPNIEDVRTVYNNNKHTIRTIESFIKLINDNFYISQYELFEHFNGTYYNMVCRVPCRKTNMAAVQRRRRYSHIPSRYVPEIRNIDYFTDDKRNEYGEGSTYNKTVQLHSLTIQLCKAIDTNNIDFVKELLTSGADVNGKDSKGRTPLHYAVIVHNINIVELLLQNHANPNRQGIYRETPLHMAASINDQKLHEVYLDIVELLLQNGANPKITDVNGETPLDIAKKNNRDMYNILIRSHKKPDTVSSSSQYELTNQLFKAIPNNNIDLVKKLLTHGADPNIPNSAGTTPLYFAVRVHNKDIVELLLKKNANPNTQISDGVTPLHIAASNNDPQLYEVYLEIAFLLLKNGANRDIKNDYNYTPLDIANYNKNDDMVNLLKEYYATQDTNINRTKNNSSLKKPDIVNSSSQDELTNQLCKAIEKIDTNLVKKLLTKVADVNGKNSKGITPLFYAVSYYNQQIIQLLLTKGANPNIPNDNGLTPLYNAVDTRYINGVKLLLDNGADPNTTYDNGVSPLHIAVGDNTIKIIELLLEHNADPNKQNNNGITPLYYAVIKKYKDIIKLLLDNDANPYIPNKINITPLQYARDNNLDKDIINLLKSPKYEHFRGNTYMMNKFKNFFTRKKKSS